MITLMILKLYITFPCMWTYGLFFLFNNSSPQTFHVLFVLIILLGIVILLIIFLNLFLYLKQLYLDQFTDKNLRFFDNPFNENEFRLCLMNYKITNIYYSIFKCIILFIPLFLTIYFLRYTRLGEEINIKVSLSKFLDLPFMFQFFAIIILILYIFNLQLFFSNILLRLIFEMKKIYIWCYQFGTYLDPNHYSYYSKILYEQSLTKKLYYNYIDFFIFNLIRRISPYRIRPHISFFTTNKPLRKFIYGTTKDIMTELPAIFYLLLYLYHFSKFKNNIIVKKLMVFFKFVNLNFENILEFLPYIFLILVFIHEIYFNHYILYKMYYAIFLTLLYKIFIKLCYFLEYVDEERAAHTCMYYYKEEVLKSLKIKSFYASRLMKEYKEATVMIYNKLQTAWFLAGLDIYKARNYIHKKEATKIQIFIAKVKKNINDLGLIKVIKKINKKYFEINNTTFYSE